MGAKSSKQGLHEARERAVKRTSTIQISGRYHHLPHQLNDDYRLSEAILGCGISGSVVKCTSRRASKSCERIFAVKSFKLHGISRERREILEAEVEIFLLMDHPHVCRLFDVYEGNDTLELVMECLEGGELHEHINDRQRFSEREAADATNQMLLAINYLHGRGIVHRDLKLENWLYEKKDSDHLKLIDFGFGKIWEPNKKMKAQLGTISYMAPEMFLPHGYTQMCDLWSLGVIVFVLLVGYMPFPLRADQERMILEILNGDYAIDKAKWSKVSANALDFVQKLLTFDPSKRLTAEGAMQHPWIASRTQLSSTESALDVTVVTSLCNFAHASRFRRACMQLMAWSLSSDEQAKVMQAFLELDQNKQGVITLHDLKKVLEERFNVDGEQAIQIFDALDEDNRDEVNYSSFLAAMMATRIEVHEDLVASAFRRFDTEGDGFITVQNLRTILGESLAEDEEIEHLVAEVNTSSGGKISYAEFMEYICSDVASPKHREIAERFVDAEIRRPELLAITPLSDDPSSLRSPSACKVSRSGFPITPPPQNRLLRKAELFSERNSRASATSVRSRACCVL